MIALNGRSLLEARCFPQSYPPLVEPEATFSLPAKQPLLYIFHLPLITTAEMEGIFILLFFTDTQAARLKP